MKKILAYTISACFACGVAGTAIAQEDPEELDRMEVEREATDQPKRYRNIYAPQFKEDDTSQLRSEPCPDYFDTDWGLTHDPGDPCWNAYITSVGDENVPRAAREKIAETDTETDTDRMTFETEREPAEFDTRQETDTRVTQTERTVETDEDCVEEDLSDQAVAQRDYDSALQEAESGEKDSLSDDFDPNSNTAKSVAQLQDNDIEQAHLDATFAALDDNGSNGIDRIEALGVRGLADEFDAIDFNGDGVVSEAEYNLYFDGELADNEAICIDGQRVTQLSQVQS